MRILGSCHCHDFVSHWFDLGNHSSLDVLTPVELELPIHSPTQVGLRSDLLTGSSDFSKLGEWAFVPPEGGDCNVVALIKKEAEEIDRVLLDRLEFFLLPKEGNKILSF